MAKVDEILAKGKVKKHLHKPDSVSMLVHVWQEMHFELYGQTCLNLTWKQKGQLGNFMKGCPEKRSAHFLRWILQNWSEFISEVTLKTGKKNTPPYPDVGFLLLNVGIAVNLVLSQEKVKATKEQEAPKTSQVAKNVQLISQDPDKQKPTKAQLLEIIGSGGKKG